jgi:peptide/nickel transport system permease protein
MNKGAMAGLIIIVISILIAIFGYFLSPDPSPFANRIILEIGGEKPGYEQQFILVKKERAITVDLLTRLISGKPDQYDYIPIVDYYS